MKEFLSHSNLSVADSSQSLWNARKFQRALEVEEVSFGLLSERFCDLIALTQPHMKIVGNISRDWTGFLARKQSDDCICSHTKRRERDRLTAMMFKGVLLYCWRGVLTLPLPFRMSIVSIVAEHCVIDTRSELSTGIKQWSGSPTIIMYNI